MSGMDGTLCNTQPGKKASDQKIPLETGMPIRKTQLRETAQPMVSELGEIKGSVETGLVSGVGLTRRGSSDHSAFEYYGESSGHDRNVYCVVL